MLTLREGKRPAIPIAPFKLQHDAEQIRRLCSAGRIDPSFDKIADTYEQVLAALPPDAPPDEPIALSIGSGGGSPLLQPPSAPPRSPG